MAYFGHIWVISYDNKMDICDKWKLNKSINPRTNRKIKPTGKVYKDLEVECANISPKSRRAGGPEKNIDPYSPKCLKWRNNPEVNPTTNRKIKPGGPTYQKLKKECGSPSDTLPTPAAAPAAPAAAPAAAAKAAVPLADECDEWKANPGKNPRTNRAISPRGKIYKWYQKNCEDVGVKTPTKLQTWLTKKPDKGLRVRSKAPDEETKKPDKGLRVGAKAPAETQTWFTERLEKGLRINNNLRDINADQWDMCMTGNKAPAFRSHFSNVIEIGRGSFGQVYRATLKNSPEQLVIKEAYLLPEDNRVLKKTTGQNQKWEDIPKNSYPQENRILDLVNQLLLSRKCPNFVYIYNMAMCDGCKVQRFFDLETPKIGSCYVTFMESATIDMNKVNLTNFQSQLSVLYQLLIAVYAIHRYYAIWHRDIKTSNVFIQQIKPGGYFEYVIEDKTYYVKNTGVVVYLADFGVSHVLSPLYSFQGYYGKRNAEVMRSSEEVDGSNLYWKPISIADRLPIDWYDETTGSTVQGTINRITSFNIKNSKSSTPINLNNNQKFPAFEFFGDIQDVIRMFVGGKQTEQPGKHMPMKTLTRELMHLLITKSAYVPSLDYIYKLHGTVQYVLAGEMLDQLYLKPQFVDNVVDRFVM